MSIPSTHKVFRRTEGDIPRTVQQTTESLPSVEELGPDDVLIKVQDRGIPCSDCAGEVVAIGTSVQDFAVGDRVAPIFDITNFTGLEDEPGRALGGDVAGVLREYAVFKENILVRLPYSLTWEEASTLSCAGVTAWTALEGLQTPRKDAAALMQGTGGVSLFALALCIANGTKAIITSSSDDKLEAVKKLGPDVHGINYKTTLNQRDAILEITNGKGVDYVVNNTGPGSIPDDISFLRGRGGTISLIGFLDGFSGKWEPSAIMALMGKHAKIRGIGVGSKADYQEMNKFIEEKKVNLGPIIDRVFSFDDSKAAFDYLYSGKHTGKVVIKI